MDDPPAAAHANPNHIYFGLSESPAPAHVKSDAPSTINPAGQSPAYMSPSAKLGGPSSSFSSSSALPPAAGCSSPFHINLAAAKALAAASSSSAAAGGDVYEFHSSPEEDLAQPPPLTSSATGGLAYHLPASSAAAISPLSIVIQQKSSSASSIPSMLQSTPPPNKRIKTAILAKKLLAAAVDSNIIDSAGLPLNSPQGGGKSADRVTVAAEEGQQKQGDSGEQKNMAEGEDEMEEELGGSEEKQQTVGNCEGEMAQVQQKRAHSFTWGAAVAQPQAEPEQKKVPPLRISLLKTPSEESEGGGPSTAQIVVANAANSPSFSTAARRNRGGRTTAKRQGNGSKKESDQQHQQRVTRSRIRQIATVAEGGEGSPTPAGSSRKRARYRDSSSALLSAAENAPALGGLPPINFLEEEDTMSSTTADGGAEETAGQGGKLAEDQSKSEDSQQSAMAATGTGPADSKDGKERSAALSSAAGSSKQTPPSAAAQLLSKNSLDQSIEFEAKIREKWVSEYKGHLIHVLERVTISKPLPELVDLRILKYETRMNKDWPNVLQKMFIEQERRRQELAEEHQLERERLSQMAQRELARVGEAGRLMAAGESAKEEMGKTEAGEGGEPQKQKTAAPVFRRLLPFVSLLRDSEHYDPGLLLADQQNAPKLLAPSLQQIQQRFAYLANTTKNRHTMEAQALLETQKAEWIRAARKVMREEEQQQMMMKGPIGAGGPGKLSFHPQQQQKKPLLPPADCWIESAVPPVQVFDTQLPPFRLTPAANSTAQ